MTTDLIGWIITQGPSHGFMDAEQELPHHESTVEYGLLSSHVSGNMADNIQYLEEGDGLPLAPSIDSKRTQASII